MTGSRRALALGGCLAALVLGLAGGPGAATSEARAAADERPEMQFDPIAFGAQRKTDTAAYSKRHYGNRKWRLNKRRVAGIVLHYTAGSSYAGAWTTFNANDETNGEPPGLCTHFIVDKDGTIYQLVRLRIRCRQAIGINHRSVGIEMVQEDVGGPGATAQAILDRRVQARAAVRLVAWLKIKFGVRMKNLIGHAIVNDSPLFKDLTGARNTHSDWLPSKVSEFRSRVAERIG